MSGVDNNQLARKVGRTVAHYRQVRSLTQEDLAERLGIGPEAVSRIERGLVLPSLGRLLELAEVFHCEAAALLTEASTSTVDQAKYLDGVLAGLESADRAMIVDMVTRLAARLAR